jgi:hypothetical protein
MNDPLKTIENLAESARGETAFPIDVANQILSQIRRASRAPIRTVVWIVAGVAVLVVVIFPLADLFADPWSACFALFAGN